MFLRHSLALLPLAAALTVHAQTEATHLERVVTTGNPLRDRDALTPVQQLSGEALTLARGTNLADTLAAVPGLAGTYFGPNANRPTLRGLDGDRVKLLNNSGASTDASSLSFDHAVPVDPLVVERIEVLRGPAALLYGGSALGGVVNAIDNRIPRAAQPGLAGAAELRLGGAAREKGGALVLDGASERFAWHADAAARDADDTRTPRFTSPDGESDRVRNSAARSHAGSIGGSWLFTGGYAGVSVEDYHNDYGVTVEPDVRIKMQRQRLATAGEWTATQGLIRRLSWQASRSRYQHLEVEGTGEVGTRFGSKGNDLRLELEHAPLGGVKGVLGVQAEPSRFEALGEEAFVPSTETRSRALFLLEQWQQGPLSLSAGGRVESVRVASAGGGEDDRFGEPLRRSFSPKSFALKAGWQLSPAWSTSLALQHSQRAPSHFELFADGLHVATGAYEVGDKGLGLERARSLDLGLQWQLEGARVRLSAYSTRIDDYVSLQATGATRPDEEGEQIPVYAFRAVPARLQGFEFEVSQRFELAQGWRLATHGQIDRVRGEQRDTGEPLPRLAPLRARAGFDLTQGPWHVGLDAVWAGAQKRVPMLDSATPGYTLVNLRAARHFKIGERELLWFVKLDNAGNRLAYNAGSAETIKPWAPLPGRALFTGLRLSI